MGHILARCSGAWQEKCSPVAGASKVTRLAASAQCLDSPSRERRGAALRQDPAGASSGFQPQPPARGAAIFWPERPKHISPGQSGAASAAERRPGLANHEFRGRVPNVTMPRNVAETATSERVGRGLCVLGSRRVLKHLGLGRLLRYSFSRGIADAQPLANSCHPYRGEDLDNVTRRAESAQCLDTRCRAIQAVACRHLVAGASSPSSAK